MKLVGLMPARNESYCLGLTARAALMWCDALVILDHASTDSTPEIISEVFSEHPGRLFRMYEASTTWDEMNHRQAMLQIARALGATHIAIVDADEILTGNMLQPNGPPFRVPFWDNSILQLPGYNLRGSLSRYHANGIWGNRSFSLAFQDNNKLGWTGDRFHHREPSGMRLRPHQPVAQGGGGIMHLWGVSERRLIAKHALYKITERIRWPEKSVIEIDRMYSWWHSPCAVGSKEPKWAYNDVPDSWWKPYSHLMQHLYVNAVPWQEEECRRLFAEHGADNFVGLDLFGVV